MLDTAHPMAIAAVARSLYNKAISNHPNSVTAAIFYLKCQAGWKEPSQGVDVNLNGNVTTFAAPAGMTLAKFSKLAKKFASDV